MVGDISSRKIQVWIMSPVLLFSLVNVAIPISGAPSMGLLPR
jgi:hypothetical protein